MLRRKMKGERRENFAGFTAFAGIVCAFVASLTGCSETNTAGVLSETESGQQASIDVNGDKVVNVNGCSTGIPNNLKKQTAFGNGLDEFGNSNEIACITYDRDYTIINVKGSAVDENGNAIKNVRVSLKRVESEYSGNSVTLKKTSTDASGNYSFKDVVYKATYTGVIPDKLDFELDEKGLPVVYYNYTLHIESEDKALASYTSLDLRSAEKVTEDKNTYRKISEQELHKTSSEKIHFDNDFFSVGNKVCLDYTEACHTITSQDSAQGSFLMEGIPEGAYQNLCKYEASLTGSAEITCKTLDNSVISGTTADTLAFTLPDDAGILLDSLSDKSLEHLIVPVSGKNISANTLLVNSNNISRLTAANGKGDGFSYWAEINFPDGSDKASYSLIDGTPTGISSNILLAEKSLQNTTIEKGYGFLQQRNIGYSFKFSFDGSKSDTAAVLFSTLEEDWNGELHGFDVRQCEAGSKDVCTRIYSRKAKEDTTYENQAFSETTTLLDGDQHQFAIALVGNHLTLAVDEEIIRDTDLKLYQYHEAYVSNGRENFVTAGVVELQDFVAFRITSDIKKSKDTNWNRLKAWLTAHQLMSLH